jgi:hypothetical protein
LVDGTQYISAGNSIKEASASLRKLEEEHKEATEVIQQLSQSHPQDVASAIAQYRFKLQEVLARKTENYRTHDGPGLLRAFSGLMKEFSTLNTTVVAKLRQLRDSS